MAAYAQPPTDPKVNSYCELDAANLILQRRLYTDAWDNASQSPGAWDYVVDDPGATLTPGATSIPVRDGVRNWTDGDLITFGSTLPGDGSQTYTIVGDFSPPVTTITISPGLVVVPGDGAAVNRFTPNERESALIWATCVLDYQMDWFGSQRYASRGTNVTSTPQQNLRWPRAGVHDFAGYPFIAEQYPEILVQVTAETALYLLQRDLAQTPALLGLGFKKAEIPGPIKVEVDSLQRVPMIPDYLYSKLRELGVPNASGLSGSMSFARTYRT
jgi:hypothetical protein